ncbi:Plasmodium exported protein, unknown function [Plasmodium relictum]|uniref:Plasmodium RESA N-terminal domain-containing protein n=1 Tax=Plasmodium relictum TaxID=85471 RepID=A0A1J1GKF5_PLARL|nr:Plasmodium exported protein, unknown function [Plasmodium relictum]CRG85046.1 Plasmodium exported protein, unknown function [Plasmodium relictum]
MEDLNREILASNSMNMKSYSTYLHINKEGIIKVMSCTIPVIFKLFTMLFPVFLCFLLEENLSISVIKFNKCYLRILSETELENKNNPAYNDTLLESFFEFFKNEKISLKMRAYKKWEEMCFFEGVRYSLDGRSWERDKFQEWYDKMQKDIDSFRASTVDEYNKLKESFSKDAECSEFFIMKRKEWKKYKDSTYKLFKKYVKDCNEEWDERKNKNKK